jgi:hypothetical protein
LGAVAGPVSTGRGVQVAEVEAVGRNRREVVFRAKKEALDAVVDGAAAAAC